MNISIVNFTRGPKHVTDTRVLDVIRAINRQIAEDFAPHWHMGARLRLDAAVSEKPGGTELPHESLRGDAIIYLVTSDGPEDYLGYHESHNDGIPFGFVLTDAGDELDDAWSITLSHEALELIADPYVNMLCKGPHPDPKHKYDVFHWFEMCDAVQDEDYAIDGVRVSNFVLPSYFTVHEETGARNDFLGTVKNGKSLRSFGVNPGGYVGFYDARVGEDSQFDANDARAKERAALKRAFGEQRRRNRRMSGADTGTREVIEPGVELESFWLDVQDASDSRTAWARAEQIVRTHLAGWTVAPFWKDDSKPTQFDLTPPVGERLAPSQAWECARAITASEGDVAMDPLFAVSVAPPPAAVPGRRASGGGYNKHLPATDRNYDWHLKMTRVPEAWQVPGSVERYGKGIVIGHPDTGYTTHPEITPSLLIGRGWDFVRDDDDPEDELVGGVLQFPSHGTGTASVIVSPSGSQHGGDYVSGVAPEARLVPYRVSTSVVLWSTANLAKAIRWAMDMGCHVVSISMGAGWGSGALEKAVKDAVAEGVIIVCAAGNEVGFVVHPAAYEEVIAVAACNFNEEAWKGSSHGAAVDITAPGESVYRAETRRNAAGGYDYIVERSHGTSFATATTAGIAALWLAHHGRDALIRQYGPAGMVAVFKHLLATVGFRPGPKLGSGFGAGIIDAEKLLNAPLPPTAPTGPAPGTRARRARGRAVPPKAGGLEAELDRVFPDLEPIQIAAAATALGGDRHADMPAHVASEIGFLCATNANLRAQVVESVDTGNWAPVRAALASLGSSTLAEAYGPQRLRRGDGIPPPAGPKAKRPRKK